MRRPRPFPFSAYNGHYHKIEYDVLTEEGEIIFNCWPNAGIFYTPDSRRISDTQVSALRPAGNAARLSQEAATNTTK
jgi:hypothetical protein